MVTQRSVSLFFTILFLTTSFQSSAAQAQLSDGTTNFVAVGLLSSSDEQRVAVAGPFRAGERLSAIMVSCDGTVSHQALSGDIFLALDQSASSPWQQSGDQGAVAAEESTFSVQTGSYGGKEAAERFAAEVRGHWPEKEVWVAEARLGGGGSAHRVMAGRFPDRKQALAFTVTLAAYGMDGSFVVETGRNSTAEQGRTAGERTLILYSQGTGLVLGLEQVTITAALPVPENDEIPPPAFRLDGASYRGSLEVRGGETGIIAVNRVPLEDYLLGVVPCELGPDRFPLLEALKAQAVAARTYTLKHLGRHRGEGFDLCDTPHCQVYGGAGREKPLSSEAVRQTAGLAAFHQGTLAETLYTSTCGGRTEISSAVFSGPAEPYLGGVPCTTGRRSGITISRNQVRRSPAVKERETGADLGFSLGLLAALGIVEDGEVTGSNDVEPGVGRAEAGKWIGRVLLRHDRKHEAVEGAEAGSYSRLPSRSQLALQLCLALGWKERMDVLFTVEDLDEILGSDCDCGDDERRALACLVTAGIFHRHLDGSVAANHSMSRGAFCAALARLVLYLEPGLLAQSALAGAEEGRLVLRTGEMVEQREIAHCGIRLFEQRKDATLPIAADRFRIGDRVLVLLDRQWRVLMMVRIPADGGVSADRYSPYALWSIVMDREAIEALLQENGHQVGRLVDLLPLERGPGGRLTRLRVVGSSGNTVLRGLDIRWNLGTRENFFFIDRLADPEGSIRAYRFTGRGWGHGVGMCQVGAAGLAETGATFIEILEHYYPGIRIEPAAGISSRP